MNWRKWMALGSLVIAFLMVGIPVRAIYTYGRTLPEEADVIIVLGCKLNGDRPSLFLQYRLNAALQVYEQGLAKHIIVSGGQGPDEWIPEAVAMKQYLIDRGVPEYRIGTEEESTTTYENLKLSKALMDEQGFKSAIIVSSDFHIYRSVTLAKKLGIDASGAPAGIPSVLGARTRYVLREVPAIYRDVVFR